MQNNIFQVEFEICQLREKCFQLTWSITKMTDTNKEAKLSWQKYLCQQSSGDQTLTDPSAHDTLLPAATKIKFDVEDLMLDKSKTSPRSPSSLQPHDLNRPPIISGSDAAPSSSAANVATLQRSI